MQPRSRFVGIRFTEEEFEKIGVMMENYGYKSISQFVRDLLFKKQLQTHREVVVVTDKAFRDRMNNLIFQIRKLGVNYNQVVTVYQQQARMFKADGSPVLNTQALDRTMTRLMKITEDLRDEVSVVIELVKSYLPGRDGGGAQPEGQTHNTTPYDQD